MKDSKFINFLNSEYQNAKDSLENHETLSIISDELKSCENRYSDSEELDQGGMKVITRVYDNITDRILVKAKSKFPEKKDHTELFLREARITASLQHPNIVPIHDIGFDPDNSPYFIMKMIEGKNYKEYLSQEKDLQSNLNTFLKVCDGIEYAHSQGIVHLDLKPANIIVGEHGEVIIIDWGLAKVIYEDCKEELLKKDSLDFCNLQLTLFGRGTPGFMAPEQFKNGEALTRHSDIYSLGAILYYLLTGHSPHPGKNYDEIKKNTVSGNVKAPSLAQPDKDIPLGLEAICMKALHTKYDERYQSVEEMTAEIRAYMNGFAPKAENAGFLTQLKLLYLRNKAIINVALSALLIIIIGLTWFINKIKESENLNRLAKEKLEAEAQRRETAENSALRGTVSIAWKYLQNANLKGAMDQTAIAMHYAPTYIEPYRLATLINLAKLNFKEARKYSEKLTEQQYKDLRETCSKLSANPGPDSYLDIVRIFKINDSVQIYPYVISNILKKLNQNERNQFIVGLIKLHNEELELSSISISPDSKELKISSQNFMNFPPLPGSSFSHITLNAGELKNTDNLSKMEIENLNIAGCQLKDFNFLLNLKSLKTLTVSKKQLPEKISEALTCRIMEL